MSSKKMSAPTSAEVQGQSAAQGPDPEIRKLRETLGLSQEQLAKSLGINRISVLQWENGKTKPSNELHIKLAKLATAHKGANARYFWEKAGVDVNTLGALIPEIATTLREFEKQRRTLAGDVINIPLLKPAYSEFIARPSTAPNSAIAAWLPWPSEAVKQLPATCCLWGPVEFSRSRFVPGRQILLLDSSECEPSKLIDEMVLVENTKPSDGYPAGLYTGWLHRLDLEKLGQGSNLSDLIVLNDDPSGFGTHVRNRLTTPNVPGLTESEAARLTALAWTRFETSPGAVIRGGSARHWRVLARVIGLLSYKLPVARAPEPK
ncbi:MAG: helix-turn-helix domain-containing protein [Terriglobales bacterium]